MLSRKLLFAGLMAGAVVVPYVLNNKELTQRVSNWAHGMVDKSHTTGSWESMPVSATSSPPNDNSWSPWSLLGGGNSNAEPVPQQFAAPVAPRIEYDDILRFDLVPESVLQRWPRVSQIAPEAGLSGLRVPLVTGPGDDDIVGSLTYYFDNRRQLQRIILQGNTGDPRRLVTCATSNYQFQQLPSLSAGLYVCVESNEPQSLLQITYAPVIQATDKHNRVAVVLELNRPGRYLSAAGRQVLDQDKQLSHW